MNFAPAAIGVQQFHLINMMARLIAVQFHIEHIAAVFFLDHFQDVGQRTKTPRRHGLAHVVVLRSHGNHGHGQQDGGNGGKNPLVHANTHGDHEQHPKQPCLNES